LYHISKKYSILQVLKYLFEQVLKFKGRKY